MAQRASWDGFLRFNLIAVPVRAFSAQAPGRGRVTFHQIHANCNQRIRHQKICPIHGEVSQQEIVSGYEIAKDQYVLFDPSELKALRAESGHSIDIDVFIHPDALDPIYLTERTYYLAPDGAAGEKPYAVFQSVMKEKKLHAIGKMVVSDREQPALVQPIDRLLAVTALSYAAQVKAPADFASEVPSAKVAPAEFKLARTLLDTATVKKLDYSRYEDHYTEEVRKLIEAKAAGKKITIPHEAPEPAVINLMDALRKSLKTAKAAPSNGRSRKQARARATDLARPHRTARRKTG